MSDCHGSMRGCELPIMIGIQGKLGIMEEICEWILRSYFVPLRFQDSLQTILEEEFDKTVVPWILTLPKTAVSILHMISLHSGSLRQMSP